MQSLIIIHITEYYKYLTCNINSAPIKTETGYSLNLKSAGKKQLFGCIAYVTK